MAKNIARLFLLFAFITASLAIARQQSSPSADPVAPSSHQSLAQRLALTREQRAQLREITQDRKQQTEAVKADASLTPKARRQKLREINAEAEAKIRSMLTANQLEEYDQIKAERREAARNRRQTTTAPTDPPPQTPQ